MDTESHEMDEIQKLPICEEDEDDYSDNDTETASEGSNYADAESGEINQLDLDHTNNRTIQAARQIEKTSVKQNILDILKNIENPTIDDLKSAYDNEIYNEKLSDKLNEYTQDWSLQKVKNPSTNKKVKLLNKLLEENNIFIDKTDADIFDIVKKLKETYTEAKHEHNGYEFEDKK